MSSRPFCIYLCNVIGLDTYSVRQVRDKFADIPHKVTKDTSWLLDRIVDFMDTDFNIMSRAIRYFMNDFNVVSKLDKQSEVESVQPIMYKEDIVPSNVFNFNATTLTWFINSNPWCVKIVISECVAFFDQYRSKGNGPFDKPSFARQFIRGYKKLHEEVKELGDSHNQIFIVNYVALDLNIQEDDPDEVLLSSELIEILILQMPFEEIHTIYPLSSQYRHVLDRADVLSALEQRWQLRDIEDYEDLYDQYVMKYPVDFVLEDYNGEIIYYLEKNKYIYHGVRRDSPEYLDAIIMETEEDLRFAIDASIEYGRDIMLHKYIGMIMTIPNSGQEIEDWMNHLYDTQGQSVKDALLVNGFTPRHFDITEENLNNIETVVLSKLQHETNKLYYRLRIDEAQETVFTPILIAMLRRVIDALEGPLL